MLLVCVSNDSFGARHVFCVGDVIVFFKRLYLEVVVRILFIFIHSSVMLFLYSAFIVGVYYFFYYDFLKRIGWVS